MPTYTMENTETGEVKEMVLSFSDRDELLESGQWKQLLSTPKFVTGVKSTLSQTSDGWKDLLGNIKKGSGKGNTINN